MNFVHLGRVFLLKQAIHRQPFPGDGYARESGCNAASALVVNVVVMVMTTVMLSEVIAKVINWV